MDYTSIILLSGGIDSTVLAHSLVKEKNEVPLAIVFKYGQRHREEIACAQIQASILNLQLDVLDVTNLFSRSKSALCGANLNVPNTIDTLGDAQPVTYVPWRNGIFLTIALNIAESIGVNRIYYGAQLNDNYQYFDTTFEFINTMNSLTLLNRKHSCNIIAPFASTPKVDIIALGYKLNVDFSRALSCYNPSNGFSYIRACGKCPSCTQRLKAFLTLKKNDPFKYKNG